MPEFFTVLGIIVAAIAALALFVLSLRGTLTIAYDGEFSLYFRVLFFNIRLFPFKKRKKHYRKHMSAFEAEQIRKAARRKAEKRRKAKKKQPVQKEPEQKTEKKDRGQKQSIPVGLIAREIIDILSVFTEVTAIIVKRFTHHLRVKVARFNVRIATEDPAVTAVTYGAASQIINVLIPILSTVDNFTLPKRKYFDISADFTSTVPEIDIKLAFSLRAWHMADIGIRAALGAISKYVGRKGGVDNTFKHIVKLFKSIIPPEESPANTTEENKK